MHAPLSCNFSLKNSSLGSLVIVATANKWMAYRKDIAFELRNHDIFVRPYANVLPREPAFHSGRLVHRTVVERYSSLIGRGIATTLNKTSKTLHFSVQGERKMGNFKEGDVARWDFNVTAWNMVEYNGGHKISRFAVQKSWLPVIISKSHLAG